MADTLPNIRLPQNQWVNLYTASGIPVGTRIQIQNVGNTDVQTVTSATAPTAATGYNKIRPTSLTFVSQASPSGAWARSPSGLGVVNVGRA